MQRHREKQCLSWPAVLGRPIPKPVMARECGPPSSRLEKWCVLTLRAERHERIHARQPGWPAFAGHDKFYFSLSLCVKIAAVPPHRARGNRSEERRVGKECRARWPPYGLKNKDAGRPGTNGRARQ